MNHNETSPPELPVPELEPQEIALDEFWIIADDKFEYVEGFLFDPPETNSTREPERASPVGASPVVFFAEGLRFA